MSQKDNNSWVPYILLLTLGTGLNLGLVGMAVNVTRGNKDGFTLLATVGVNVLIFIAIVVQAFIYKRQAEMMQDGLTKTQSLIEQNERFFAMTERPILVVEKATAPLRLNEPMKMTVVVVNKGRTAAQKLRIFFRLSEPGEIEFPFVGEYFDCHFLAANDTLTIHDEGNPVRICDKETFRSVVERFDKTIYIYGDGTYEDLTGRQYSLDKWTFTWTREHGFINDYVTLPFYVKFRSTLKEASRRKSRQDKNKKAN
jgi:hypothetical protein